MATYRPIKRILIPLFACMIGIGFAFLFMPTKMNATWKDWKRLTEQLELAVYEVESTYHKDEQYASSATGIWSKNNSHYTLSAFVTEDTNFDFQFTIENEGLYIKSGDSWRQTTINERFISELAPLDDPFVWMRDMISYAKEVEKIKNEHQTIYRATFVHFDDVDFRGYVLVDQEETNLTFTVEEGQLSILFHVIPIRPNHIGVFDGYPKEIIYELILTDTTKKVPALPAEAYESKGIDE